MSSNDVYQFDNLPNRLTLFRIILVPIVIVSLIFQQHQITWIFEEVRYYGWLAGWCFVIASITDFFDGYIARKKNIVTVFGSFLDPIADKFLVVSSLIMLLALSRIPQWVVIILVLREMYMTSLRLLAINEGVRVPVNWWGKWKTAIQMMAIPMLMVDQKWWILPFSTMGDILIYLASVLSLLSAVLYSINLVKKIGIRRMELKNAKQDATPPTH